MSAFLLLLAAYPLVASAFYLDLACQVFLASIGALSLMLLTGYAGQVSLGHAGLLIGRRLHRRHPVPRIQRAVLDHAAGRRARPARCSA